MGLLTSCRKLKIQMTQSFLFCLLGQVWALTLSTGLWVCRVGSWTDYVVDSSTLVVRLWMPSLSHGQGITIGCFLHHTWFLMSCATSDGGEDGTLLVPQWHSTPWWPLLITKRGTWKGFATNSLRIQLMTVSLFQEQLPVVSLQQVCHFFWTTATSALLLWLPCWDCLLAHVAHYSSDKDTAAGDPLVVQSCPWWLVPCTSPCLLLFELQACYGHLFVFTQLLWLIGCFGS